MGSQSRNTHIGLVAFFATKWAVVAVKSFMKLLEIKSLILLYASSSNSRFGSTSLLRVAGLGVRLLVGGHSSSDLSGPSDGSGSKYFHSFCCLTWVWMASPKNHNLFCFGSEKSYRDSSKIPR